MHLRLHPLKLAVTASLLAMAGSTFAQSTPERDLVKRLDQLATELANVKAQLTQLQEQRAAATPATAPVQETTAHAEPKTVLSSYGEISYNRPTNSTKDTQADLKRFVLGFQHRFDPKTKVVAEMEVEHSVTSKDDDGEVAIEQAYVEHQFHPNWAMRGGLFVMPMGLLNENHEPNAFYGVERNFVETAIIPTTWREGGLQFVGTFDNGLTLQTGASTGFDLNKWDATSAENRESPLGSIHQEMSFAKARDISVFGALNWRGIPGLQLGGSLFTGGATQGQMTTTSRVLLWDLHTRWTPGRWDLSALYSRGSISNTAALNLPNVGSDFLIPETFDGWYMQAAYKLWSFQDYVLTPFARIEEYNTARSFAFIGTGVTPNAAPTEQVTTLGTNFQLTPGIVLKADVQRFRENKNANRVNLGLGWSF